MKKFVAVLLALTLALGLFGCGINESVISTEATDITTVPETTVVSVDFTPFSQYK